jgi:hypothetical protein
MRMSVRVDFSFGAPNSSKQERLPLPMKQSQGHEWESTGCGRLNRWCDAPQVECGTPEEVPGHLGKEEISQSKCSLRTGPHFAVSVAG